MQSFYTIHVNGYRLPVSRLGRSVQSKRSICFFLALQNWGQTFGPLNVKTQVVLATNRRSCTSTLNDDFVTGPSPLCYKFNFEQWWIPALGDKLWSRDIFLTKDAFLMSELIEGLLICTCHSIFYHVLCSDSRCHRKTKERKGTISLLLK